jgi:hypothetical protein
MAELSPEEREDLFAWFEQISDGISPALHAHHFSGHQSADLLAERTFSSAIATPA